MYKVSPPFPLNTGLFRLTNVCTCADSKTFPRTAVMIRRITNVQGVTPPFSLNTGLLRLTNVCTCAESKTYPITAVIITRITSIQGVTPIPPQHWAAQTDIRHYD